MSNIEDDVKYVKEMLEIARIFFKAVKAETDYKNVDEIAFCNAIQNILAEREQKDKRIQELEEKVKTKQKFIVMASEVIENSIQKQVVKDVLQNNRNELSGMTYLSKEQYKPYEMQIERLNKIEQELLETK